jgi:hypothetical protein
LITDTSRYHGFYIHSRPAGSPHSLKKLGVSPLDQVDLGDHPSRTHPYNSGFSIDENYPGLSSANSCCSCWFYCYDVIYGRFFRSADGGSPSAPHHPVSRDKEPHNGGRTTQILVVSQYMNHPAPTLFKHVNFLDHATSDGFPVWITKTVIQFDSRVAVPYT